MKRRNFLSLLSAATLTPALPTLGTAAPAAAGYNRYMYGLAVFQARTRGSLTTADLALRLGVSSSQARAMMSEMTARGVLAAVTGTARATPAATAQPKPYVRKMMRQLAEHLGDPPTPPEPTPKSSSMPIPRTAVARP